MLTSKQVCNNNLDLESTSNQFNSMTNHNEPNSDVCLGGGNYSSTGEFSNSVPLSAKTTN